ncbi:MAG: hypothetical protein ACM308_04915, partial [Qipengyuania vulgaris]
IQRKSMDVASPVSVLSEEAMAREEDLGELKLYRVPRPVTVAAKGMKQVAFLSKEAVRTRWVYEAHCDFGDEFDDWYDDPENIGDTMGETQIKLVTENTEEFGLGASLPLGSLTVYEDTSLGPQLVSELELRDYPYGQDVELELGESAQVFSECGYLGEEAPEDRGHRWSKMRVLVSNANDAPARVRLMLDYPENWEIRYRGGKVEVKDGDQIVEVTVPANGTLDHIFRVRPTKAYLD